VALREALDRGSGGTWIAEEMLTRSELALVYAEWRRPAEAEQQRAACRDIFARGDDWRGLAGRVALADAAVAGITGRLDRIQPGFQQAVDVAKRYSLPWDEAEAVHLWGRALLDARDRRSAVEKLDEALAIYRQIGAGNRWLERVLADKVRVQGTSSTSIK